MIPTKTEAGVQVMKDRSVPLTPRQRGALILMDGKRTLEEVLAATASTGVTEEDVAHLLQIGLIVDAAPPRARASAPASAVAGPAEGDRERYLEAYRLASQLTAGLGLKGFRLNLAVEAAADFKDLVALAPRLREAVGEAKFAPLAALIRGR